MGKNVIENSLNYWENTYKELNNFDVKYGDWLNDFSEIIEKCQTPIIDLGCGDGNTSYYLTNKGKKVIACDQSKYSIINTKHNVKNIYDTKCFNMLNGFPFESNYTDLIIADLSLHYFKEIDTFKILNEIKRILKPNGHLIFRVNSIEDKNFGANGNIEIENHVYLYNDKMLKRFFDKADIYHFFKDFKIESLEEHNIMKLNHEKNQTLQKRMYKVCVRNVD